MAKLVTIDNGTWKPVTLFDFRNWHGQPEGGEYPAKIDAGSVVSFKNVTDSFGSMAGIVYRDENENCDHLLAWSNPSHPIPGHGNSVWTETREMGHYTEQWERIHNILNETRLQHHDGPWNGFVSNITITDEILATVEASFTVEAPDNA